MNELKLTAKQLKFIDEYLIDFNGSAACIRAGYSKSGSRTEGSRLLANADIKAELKRRLEEASLSPDEIKKMFSDIAKANISNYLKPVKVERSEKIVKSLKQLIEEIKTEIQFEDDYALMAALEGKELLQHEKSQKARRRQIIRYTLELKKNPKATRIVWGPSQLVEELELDVAALTKDKAEGRIKSLKNGRYGIEVDLLSADVALTNLARVHAMFVDKTEHDISDDVKKLVKVGYGKKDSGD